MTADPSYFVLSESTSLDDLPDKIKEHIIAATDSDYSHRDSSLHVTELVYCLRKAYYRRMVEKEGEKGEKGIIEQTPRVKLVYVHLGGVHIFELDTRLAEQVVEEMEQKAVELWRALKEGRPPEPHNEPWECKYCEFKELCAIDDLP